VFEFKHSNQINYHLFDGKKYHNCHRCKIGWYRMLLSEQCYTNRHKKFKYNKKILSFEFSILYRTGYKVSVVLGREQKVMSRGAKVVTRGIFLVVVSAICQLWILSVSAISFALSNTFCGHNVIHPEHGNNKAAVNWSLIPRNSFQLWIQPQKIRNVVSCKWKSLQMKIIWM